MAGISLQQEEVLAEKVKLFPVLYDKKCKGYKERDAVNNAWAAVAEDLDFAENGELFICFILFGCFRELSVLVSKWLYSHRLILC